MQLYSCKWPSDPNQKFVEKDPAVSEDPTDPTTTVDTVLTSRDLFPTADTNPMTALLEDIRGQ